MDENAKIERLKAKLSPEAEELVEAIERGPESGENLDGFAEDLTERIEELPSSQQELVVRILELRGQARKAREEESRRLARESFETLPKDAQDRLLRYAHDVIAKQAEEKGIPVEEAATPELIDEAAMGALELGLANISARVQEAMTTEEYERIMSEETDRLRREQGTRVVSLVDVREAMEARIFSEYGHILGLGRFGRDEGEDE